LGASLENGATAVGPEWLNYIMQCRRAKRKLLANGAFLQ